ncbi:NAD-dependent epimerase/dehydratase family protein [Neobacillus sp. MER 74]|uniref:NAD-dependent epimerase/dehydratase family protein n=1 Tax=Neobacillus sp. MER 74 TaxID=2939566 RepID=UPI00203C2E6D|nr:NAD-dependent epimerase/dehydratase family protein [Neobacillus sp. MER 74]MCM3116382.1 NAD-dependent epimerase/dehydratase family protein [Neobacillus sp. MER 74]
MRKVIVTGGAGFIGSHIVEELLQNNYHVTVIDNFSTGRQKNIDHLPIEIYNHDITHPSVIDLIVSLSPDYIIHQAAQVSVAESVKDFLFDEKVNIKGSLHIIKAAIESKVKRFVFASSAAVYGNPVSLPVTISHPTHPESPYGLTKLSVENYLKMSCELYQLPYSILRYSNVYGPRQDAKGEGGVVAIFSDKLTENRTPFIYGDGLQTRDFIFVKDVATANVKALNVKENICVHASSGSCISINELFETMTEAAGSNLRPIYKQERAGDIRHSILENEETKTILNWVPAVNLFEGLQATLQFSKENQLQSLNG